MATAGPSTFQRSSAMLSGDSELLPLIQGNSFVLLQLKELIVSLSDDQYRHGGAGGVDSSIGAHVRHCLDHVQSLLDAVETGYLDYDTRERGTPVERCRSVAVETIARQCDALAGLSGYHSHDWLRLRLLTTAGVSVDHLATTLGRELGFLLSHTIHHSSLIAIAMRALGVSVPKGFGYAPATMEHAESTACAR